MTGRVPTLNETVRAAACMHLRSKRSRRAPSAALEYLFQIRSIVTGKQSTGLISNYCVGALVIAADGDGKQVNPALLRASNMLREMNAKALEGDSVSETVAYLALQLLRADWRTGDLQVARDIAEAEAAAMNTPWWSVEPF